MAANQPDRGGPIRRVAITGGTHGNESNSVQLAKHLIRHPALAQRESFSSTVLLNNPAAIERNVRYCDEDLNRCFTLADLADESRNSIEAKRAREINAQLGPKGSEGAVDYVLDLHNTTANTGVAIMCSPHDRLSHALVAHLQAKDPSVRLLLWNRSVTDYPLMPSVGKHGMTFEVGPSPWGCVVGSQYAQSLKLIGHALDFLHAHNSALEAADSTGWREASVEAFVSVGKRRFPRDAEGDLAGMIHPQLQGRDFEPLRRGEPIFLSHSLEVTRFGDEAEAAAGAPGAEAADAEEVYAFFVGEAAYYEPSKDIAFMLARKETLAVSLPAGEAVADQNVLPEGAVDDFIFNKKANPVPNGKAAKGLLEGWRQVPNGL